MKRACVLIATHERIDITVKTILCLQQQTVSCKVVLVVSNQTEFDFFTQRFPNIYVLIYPNQPLGKKWQAGVAHAKSLDISALIIQGSDDILSSTFIETVESSLKEGINFVGLQRWYIYDPKVNELYLFDYTPKNFPLGGGRYYSLYMLNKLQWNIFDCTRNSCLDDLGWNQVKATNNYKLIRETKGTGFDILAVKGDWKVMNKLNDTFKSPNAKLLNTFKAEHATLILKEKFNYE